MNKQINQYDAQCNDIASRFWANVIKGEKDECWLWQASGSKDGYGRMNVLGVQRQATHISQYLQTGQWPTQFVLHSCDNPACVNPNHLSEGTHDQNMREAAERGRMRRGGRSNLAKLTDKQVAEIRERCDAGESLTAVAREFGVSWQTTWRIRERITWNQVLAEE